MTGVQTCALPILEKKKQNLRSPLTNNAANPIADAALLIIGMTYVVEIEATVAATFVEAEIAEAHHAVIAQKERENSVLSAVIVQKELAKHVTNAEISVVVVHATTTKIVALSTRINHHPIQTMW